MLATPLLAHAGINEALGFGLGFLAGVALIGVIVALWWDRHHQG